MPKPCRQDFPVTHLPPSVAQDDIASVVSDESLNGGGMKGNPSRPKSVLTSLLEHQLALPPSHLGDEQDKLAIV